MPETLIAGRAPGGMKEVYEVKILVCYLMNVLNAPLSQEHLLEIFTTDGTVDYFTFMTALGEMRQSHFETVLVGAETRYKLSPLGEETAANLKQALPVALRDRIVKSGMVILAKLKKDSEISTSVQPHQNGYQVTCSLHEGELEFLSLSLFAPDQTQAELIERRLYERSQEVYQRILHTLIE